MARAPDGATLSIAAMCEVVGVSRQLRAQWIQKALLPGSTTGACTDEAVYELAALACLISVLGFDEARVAWSQRDPRWTAPPASRQRLDVVYDLKRKLAVTVVTDRDIAAAVRHERPVRVVCVGDRLRVVAASVRRLRSGLSLAA